ncbi:MAG: alginate lyase family protein [Pseudomonadota bacterium]
MRGPTSTARVSGVTVNCCNPLRYNSGRVQIDMALMAGSILFNDQEGFESAIKGYVDVIDTMRADGSLPYQTVRGNAAIWYQNLGIQVLVMAAEMAALQGIDLYSYKAPSGATLHSAIAFLARSMDQPSLVYGYAAKNINPWRAGNRITDPDDHRNQFATWKLPRLQRDGASFLAWFEPYQRRFPNHPNIGLMSDVVTPIAERGTPRSKMIQLPYPFRRANATGGLFNDYSGTITSCVFKEIP